MGQHLIDRFEPETELDGDFYMCQRLHGSAGTPHIHVGLGVLDSINLAADKKGVDGSYVYYKQLLRRNNRK